MKFPLLYFVTSVLLVSGAFDSRICSNSVHFHYNAKGLCNYFIFFRSYLIGAKHLKKKVCGKTVKVADGKTMQYNVFTENITDFYDEAILQQFVPFEDDIVCEKCYALYNHKHTPSIPFAWPQGTRIRHREFNLNETLRASAKYFEPNKIINPLVLDGTMVGVFEDVKDEYIPLVQHMRPPPEINTAAKSIQRLMFPPSSRSVDTYTTEKPGIQYPLSSDSHTPSLLSEGMSTKTPPKYACMHWRFEETKCGWKSHFKYPIGLCFPSSEKSPCDKVGRCEERGKTTKRSFLRSFSMDILVEAVSDVLRRSNITNLFLITDGHKRNGSATVNAFMKPFGNVVQTIHGSVTDEQLADIMKPIRLQNDFTKFAALERKVCANADMVIATASSSFSWEIFLDHAHDDEAILEAVLNNQVKNLLPWNDPNRTWSLDPGYRAAEYNDPIMRNFSMGYLPDLRPDSEKRSNIYYLDTLLARFAEKKAIVENNHHIVQKMFAAK